MKILGYNYSLYHNRPQQEIEAYGCLRTNSQKIEIATDIHNENAMSTIIHEIIEALNYHLQLKLEHNVIMSLEAGLYQVLIDNGVDLSPLMRGKIDGR